MVSLVRPPKPPRIRRIQWITLSFLLAAGVINFLDRSSLSVANTTIRSELGLSGTQIGALLSAFSLAYGVAQLPMGPLLDRVGTRIILGGAMAFWSIAQMATGLVSSFRLFIPLRMGLGLGEAPFMPAGVKAVNDWFAVEDRGRALGVVNMSGALGQALAPPLLTVILLTFGWRSMFVMLGVLGLALAIAWCPLNHNRKQVKLDPAETAYLAAGSVAELNSPISLKEWKRLFRLRSVWGMMLGFGGINYTAWLYLSWLPGYLQAERHVSIARSGWLAAVPFMAGALGMMVNGVVADDMARRGRDLIQSRRLLIVGGMVASAACTMAVAFAASTTEAVLVVSLALFFIHFAGTSAWGLVQVATPARMVASVGSIQNFGSFICASFAPILTGIILDRTHSFKLALGVCAFVTFGGALCYLLIFKHRIPDGEEQQPHSAAP
jgi:sugar phosphate permease